jgi:hypothetical protein
VSAFGARRGCVVCVPVPVGCVGFFFVVYGVLTVEVMCLRLVRGVKSGDALSVYVYYRLVPSVSPSRWDVWVSPVEDMCLRLVRGVDVWSVSPSLWDVWVSSSLCTVY